MASTEREGNWPPNASETRDNMFVQGAYSTGEMRDGHKILRNLEDEDGWEVIHPTACEVACDDSHPWGRHIRHECPWNWALEWAPVPEHYCEGEDQLPDLPRGEEIDVVWEYSAERLWTDYGWEADARLAWWLP